MITVIIAGGSGTRLWPLSTSDYPKHLLSLVGDKTMLQSTYDRAKGLGGVVYIMTEAGHAHHVRDQLPEVSEDRFIVEPGRRGTAHCIIMALDVISRSHDASEPIAFIHADHQVRDEEGFKRSFAIASEMALSSKRITLIGIEPTLPATGFGYIERGEAVNSNTGVYDVKSFKEKPNFELAKEYVRSGNYLWNCGYFVGTIRVFLDTLEQHAKSLYNTYNELHRISDVTGHEYDKYYLTLTNEVIDTALIEKTPNLAVVAASFDWVDIGSFNDLHAVNESDEKGNHFRGNHIYDDEVENAYVRNEEDKPVVVIGLDNIIVINTSNGVLVARKDLSQRVKEAVSQINEEKGRQG